MLNLRPQGLVGSSPTLSAIKNIAGILKITKGKRIRGAIIFDYLAATALVNGIGWICIKNVEGFKSVWVRLGGKTIRCERLKRSRGGLAY